MPKRRKTSRRKAKRRGITFEEANARVARLRRHHVPSRSTPENLDSPVDADIRVTTELPRHKLELVVGGGAVSRLTVVDLQQQIGTQVVRMGGIAGVSTHSDHRFKGYGRRVMENSLRWMRREGFDTAMCYGIPSYYSRFGYAPAFPSVSFSIAVRDAETVEPTGCRFVAFAPEHLKPVLRMYHRNNVTRTGPTRRDPKHWIPFRKGVHYRQKAVCKVALDKKDRPVGYFVYDASHLIATVIEVGFATMKIFPDVLRAAARRALRQRLEHIKLILPEDDAFIEFCKPLGLRKEMHYRRDGGCLVRMISIPSALRKVAAELGSRMSGAGRLTIRTNLDEVGLTWSKGKLRVGKPYQRGMQARMPQWALAQLLYGYRSAEALAATGILKGSRDAVAALARMFPVTPHFHHLVDHF